MGNEKISDEKRFIKALKIAQLFKTVENMPEKLDTL